VGELIGTFGLVFFITAAISLYVTPDQGSNLIAVALVHVFVLFALIQVLALVSGAHFNPAITVAMTALRQIRPGDALIYVILQLAGGVLGALLTRAFLSDEGAAVDYGATLVQPTLGGALPGMLAEAVATFFFVFVIVGVAVNPHARAEWGPLTIGATLGLAVFIFAPLTGAGLNPARSFGPALVSGQFGGAGEFLLVYVLGPVVGALIAAAVYFRLFITGGAKGDVGMEPVG
jgi:MIP family channel proteins